MNINEPVQSAALALPFTKAADPLAEHHLEALHLPLLKYVPHGFRNHFIAMCGEYVGTVLFLYFALSGTQVANNIPSSSTGKTAAQVESNPQQLQYIALSFGFSLAVNAWVFFRISGGLFNPAVTFGMCLIGALPWFRGVLLAFVQVLGGITAAALVACMFPGPLTVQTSLGGSTTVVQGLFIEMFLTAELVFTIFMLAAEKHKGTFIAPVGIGLSLFIAELTGVYFTGGSLNPARSFGPCVVNHSFHHYHWIYWLGPILGAIVAAGFYKFIKMLEFETANPGQDASKAKEAEAAKEAAEMEEGRIRTQGVGTSGSEQEMLPMRRTEQPDGFVNFEKQAPGVVDTNADSEGPRLESPAMGSADAAFHGLASGGMHGDESLN
ncbi:aquaporin-like protein [Mytilinidion resinicola]|uniref:Aquaporin-like protein n=1 Tax=Mytilinidion resinicola TaxID=574789 RepID=A0A6A6Y1K0_9PEZI|nr:aquaporin-like protein [Mytilinidion resinicola]KAF2802428.1 aquaporin-like protein [Mytilinidion resinicola]